ncbi:GNAT family N-acetyltransferase [Photobacterium atrarenae]|uniref:GNAT family N-acetyltransferase n=1 Tax=Photobacterium atrarenae TaxID=865757 RepID=A0ABY5GNM3_9GAMM|nr:GNAT family N-acetyltransferase [Photobacterium atrarenae]UTV30937.1 GNAT family N-acetyltransferase [Photobacterium atrarenae]
MAVHFRPATQDDLETLVLMLQDDALGSQREDGTLPLNANYLQAFDAIQADPNNQLMVAEIQDRVVGMLQLTFIPYLTHIGSWRCLIEGVRIHTDYRGQGLGEQMFQYAIGQAQEKGCQLVQLTSDKQRPDALRFYEKLGFVATHEGFKLRLLSPA